MTYLNEAGEFMYVLSRLKSVQMNITIYSEKHNLHAFVPAHARSHDTHLVKVLCSLNAESYKRRRMRNVE